MGDAINVCLPLEEATVPHYRRCQPHECRPQFFWAQSVWVSSSPGQNKDEGVCPSMSLPWEGWVAIAEEGAMVDRVENTAGMERRLRAEASLDAAEEEVPVPAHLLLLCLSSATSPSPFSSRGLSTLRSLCSASPNLLRNPGLSECTAYSVRKTT